MKSKIAADRVLKRFSRKIRKEDALKLEQKGLICLPAPQRPSNNGCAFRPVVPPMAEALVEPIESRLSILEPLSIVPAQSREDLALFDWLLWRYHYLPYSRAAGANIKYLV